VVFQSGEITMKIKDWIKFWEKDGFKLVLLKETEQDKVLWQLYSIHVPYEAEDYGRHMGALLAVDKKNKQIIAHDTTNDFVHGGSTVDRNPSQGIYSWFSRHVTAGLGGITKCV